MKEVVSKDGTRIAYDKIGSGPALILVDGALCYRASGPNGPLAALLSPHFTVITYDRRGRGDSSDKKPYAIEREIEDIEALIGEAGGSAFVYGISSGAALALEAAARIPAIRKLALFEAPFIVDSSRSPLPNDYLQKMNEWLALGRRGAAVKYFMSKGVGVPALFVAMMPFMPAWSKLKAVAHTLPYDTLLTMDYQKGTPLFPNRWSSISVPVLVTDGGKSPVWMRKAMRALAEFLPHSQYRTLEGQTHIVKPAALAPVLTEFFKF
jgi:Predicted hydrolases or acyltransferases (alpha/beta hydrolase superfamily)